jgi:hypothetical protein
MEGRPERRPDGGGVGVQQVDPARHDGRLPPGPRWS